MVSFPIEKNKKIQDNTITCGESHVEVLRERYLLKIKFWNGKTVYVTYCKFSTFGCNLFNYTEIKLVA